MPLIAAIQAGTVLGNNAATLERLRHHCLECARRGVKLAVAPEAFLGGYPKGMAFGASLGIRTDEGRALFAAYADCAIEVPGPSTEALGNIAREASLTLVVGVIEREGGTLYCTMLYLGPDGRLLGKHRKLIPTAIERLIWGCGDGSTLTVVDSEVGRVGGLICWENYMPLARMAMYSRGVQIYCTPTVDDRDVWVPTLQHIAREGRCFVVSSCQFLTRADFPPQWLQTAQNVPELPIRGGSCIVSPMGQLLAGPVYGEEAIVTADIDLRRLTEATFDFDVVGHYARPDVFEFAVKPPHTRE